MHDLEALFFSAELGGAPEIDLHGMDSNTAIQELDYFLNRHYSHREPIVKIIHGRGTGRLRQTIHAWLKHKPSLVLTVRDSTRLDEVGAVTYVAIRPNPSHAQH